MISITCRIMIFIFSYLLTWRYIDSFLYEIFFKFLDIKRNISNLTKNFYTYLNKSIEKPNQPIDIFDFQTIYTRICVSAGCISSKKLFKSPRVFSIHKIYECFVDFECHRSILKYEDLWDDFIPTILYYTIM